MQIVYSIFYTASRDENILDRISFVAFWNWSDTLTEYVALGGIIVLFMVMLSNWCYSWICLFCRNISGDIETIELERIMSRPANVQLSMSSPRNSSDRGRSITEFLRELEFSGDDGTATNTDESSSIDDSYGDNWNYSHLETDQHLMDSE